MVRNLTNCESWEARAIQLYNKREIAAAVECFCNAARAGGDWRTHAAERWICWMLLGDWHAAWQESDRAGSSLKGEHPFSSDRVLIRCQRGLGDAIQFLRYTSIFGSGREIIVEAPPHLL